MTSDHHWQEGLPPEPGSYFGFVYEITHLPTGKRYIGRKQYWFRAAGGPKQADTDIRGKKWKKHHWKPSDWRTYTGSPTDPALKRLLKTSPQDFEFAIIQQCVSKRDLSFAEPAQMHRRGVGSLRDDEGELVYLNRHIPECYGATTEWYMKGIARSEDTKEKLSKAATKPVDKPCKTCGELAWCVEKTKNGKVARRCTNCRRLAFKKHRTKKLAEEPEAFLTKKNESVRKSRAAAKEKDPEAYVEKQKAYDKRRADSRKEYDRKRRVAKKLTKTGVEWEPAAMSPLDVFISQREKA